MTFSVATIKSIVGNNDTHCRRGILGGDGVVVVVVVVVAATAAYKVVDE